jgi:hypothetical protein
MTASKPTKSTAASAAKTVLSAEVELTKSTKGTHVLSNDDMGLSGFYIPKSFFGAAGVKAEIGGKFLITVTEVL